MTIHTSTYKGKRVYIVTKDGAKFVDKFLDKKSNYVVLETYGKLSKSNIKTMTIFKNQPLNQVINPSYNDLDDESPDTPNIS